MQKPPAGGCSGAADFNEVLVRPVRAVIAEVPEHASSEFAVDTVPGLDECVNEFRKVSNFAFIQLGVRRTSFSYCLQGKVTTTANTIDKNGADEFRHERLSTYQLSIDRIDLKDFSHKTARYFLPVLTPASKFF